MLTNPKINKGLMGILYRLYLIIDNGLPAEGKIARASPIYMQYDEKVCPNIYVSENMQMKSKI